MALIGKVQHAAPLAKAVAQCITFTVRPMKGYVFMRGESTDRQDELEDRLEICLDFTLKAISSKKKKK